MLSFFSIDFDGRLRTCTAKLMKTNYYFSQCLTCRYFNDDVRGDKSEH